MKRPNPSIQRCIIGPRRFEFSICLPVLLHCFYRTSQSTVSLIQWYRLSLISLGTTTMKFAFQTVLSLSSSFAFVKGQNLGCNQWPVTVCNPATTTSIWLGTCFGVDWASLVPLSVALPLTSCWITTENTGLTGSIPTEIGELTRLTYLGLRRF